MYNCYSHENFSINNLKKELRQTCYETLMWVTTFIVYKLVRVVQKLHKILNAKYKNIIYPDLIYDLPLRQNVSIKLTGNILKEDTNGFDIRT